MLLDKLEEYYYYFGRCRSGLFILAFALVLIGVGVTVLASASLSFIGTEDYFTKQLLWCLVGVPFFLLGALVDLNFLKKHSSIIALAFVLALVAVLIPGIGKLVNGSRRWVRLFGINIQLSEFAKIALIIWLANYIDANFLEIGKFWKGFLFPLLIPGLICALVLMEPDYGTAMLMGAVIFTLLFLAGTRIPHLIAAMLTGLVCISALICVTPTRMRRVVAFLDVESNRLGGAYQAWQGMLGFVSGGLFGCGIGEGRQQLVYLPEAHTDFIFPILSEECGSLAAIAVLAIYFSMFFISAQRSKNLHNNFAKFLSYGIILTIAYQVIINIGVVTGLLPTKGMVLPFISYGGSNLVLLFSMLGLLINCHSSGINGE
jgi:cell division protein FtsW